MGHPLGKYPYVTSLCAKWYVYFIHPRTLHHRSGMQCYVNNLLCPHLDLHVRKPELPNLTL